jgi:DNA topoisomerase I
MMHTLIIVESPHKARSVAQYARGALGGEITVRSCLGHLRDLPASELGVNVDQGFWPEYQISKNRTRTVATLRPIIRTVDRVILATDPDREGEAVAWHVTKVFEKELQGKIVDRVTFNAITRNAVQTALKNPQPLDTRLVRAAVARRVMDRLIGFKLSPKLWAAVKGKDHSAGRVQTVALRLLIDDVKKTAQIPTTYTVEVEI